MEIRMVRLLRRTYVPGAHPRPQRYLSHVSQLARFLL